VLDGHDLGPLALGAVDRGERVLQRIVGTIERELAAGEVVLLDVDHEQSFHGAHLRASGVHRPRE
jgi:hypothetical protein